MSGISSTTLKQCPDFVKGGPCSAKERNGVVSNWKKKSMMGYEVGYCKPFDAKDNDAFPLVLAEKWDEGLFFMGQLEGKSVDPSGVTLLKFKTSGGNPREVRYPEFDVSTLAPAEENDSYRHDYGMYAFEGGTGPEAYVSDASKNLDMTQKPIRTASALQIGQYYWIAQQGYYFNSYYLAKDVPETKSRVKAVKYLDCKANKSENYKYKFPKAIPGYLYKVESLDNKPLLCLIQMNINNDIDYTEYMRRNTSDELFWDRIHSVYEEKYYYNNADVYLFYDQEESKFYSVARGGLTEFVGPSLLAAERANGQNAVSTSKIRSMCYYAFKRAREHPERIIQQVQFTDMPCAEFIEDDISKLSPVQTLNRIQMISETLTAALDPENEHKTDAEREEIYDAISQKIIEKNQTLSDEDIVANIKSILTPAEEDIKSLAADAAVNAISTLGDKPLNATEMAAAKDVLIQSYDNIEKGVVDISDGQQGGGWYITDKFFFPYYNRLIDTTVPADPPAALQGLLADVLKDVPNFNSTEVLNLSIIIYKKVVDYHLKQDVKFKEQFMKRLNEGDGKTKGSLSVIAWENAKASLPDILEQVGIKDFKNGVSYAATAAYAATVGATISAAWAVGWGSTALAVGGTIGVPLVIGVGSFAIFYWLAGRSAVLKRLEQQQKVIAQTCKSMVERIKTSLTPATPGSEIITSINSMNMTNPNNSIKKNYSNAVKTVNTTNPDWDAASGATAFFALKVLEIKRMVQTASTAYEKQALKIKEYTKLYKSLKEKGLSEGDIRKQFDPKDDTLYDLVKAGVDKETEEKTTKLPSPSPEQVQLLVQTMATAGIPANQVLSPSAANGLLTVPTNAMRPVTVQPPSLAAAQPFVPTALPQSGRRRAALQSTEAAKPTSGELYPGGGAAPRGGARRNTFKRRRNRNRKTRYNRK